MKNDSIILFLCILTPFIFSFNFPIDAYLPAIPEMMSKLHTTQSLMQLTISGYILIFGLAQLIIGPISDKQDVKKSCLSVP